ncbi:DNA cytosine methyltransferase [Nostoc sp. CHAB 5784]|uniref:DNA cytosine methyltransferase n=1 Tax=Nostoc mirabile TaxID=2907820 RepID=UPI0035581583|nr:DNA cytosine methyltransferase [Nostoc mirabile CHAB5784]
MQQLDLCSGVGAGFPLAGIMLKQFKLWGVAETDEYCSNILNLRFPNTRNYGDVQGITGRTSNYWFDRLKRDGIITASPPCQPFTIQGLRLGAADLRDCFPFITAAIAEYQPRFFAIENVPGLLNCRFKPGTNTFYFAWLLNQFSECGYDVEWLTVSSGMLGSPFRRERLLLVGFSRRIKFKEQPQSWAGQVRSAVEEERNFTQGASLQPGISREQFQSAYWLDRPTGRQIGIGVSSGNGVVRNRRAALGNALDWKVASIGLRRILYLNSIAR